MSRTYADVMQEIKSLQDEAERLKRQEVADVIGRIKAAIEVYGLTAADLGFGRAAAKPGPKPGKRGKRKAAANARRGAAASVKFRDGANTWGGRGKRPTWLREALAAGRKLEDFAV